ncbi:hypothetical protein JW796_01600 [Candidatus Dojkabacteria bacterium]|nr:hypothetical protein [Candidatus Dojkabacteria bacterium]
MKKESLENILISTHGGLIGNLIYRIDESYRPSGEEIMDSTIAEGGYTMLEYGDKLKVIEFDTHNHLQGFESV